MSCGADHKRGLGPPLLWLQRRPAATAPTGPLAREPPYAVSKALNSQKKQQQQKKSNFQ